MGRRSLFNSPYTTHLVNASALAILVPLHVNRLTHYIGLASFLITSTIEIYLEGGTIEWVMIPIMSSRFFYLMYWTERKRECVLTEYVLITYGIYHL